jgi:hypothetical protein
VVGKKRPDQLRRRARKMVYAPLEHPKGETTISGKVGLALPDGGSDA